MNYILVQHENLLRYKAFGRFSEERQRVSQAGANKRKRYYLHIDAGIEQFFKGLFAGGVPYWHLKVLDQERTNHLIQDQEQEKGLFAGKDHNINCTLNQLRLMSRGI